jgi:hypothetical protein
MIESIWVMMMDALPDRSLGVATMVQVLIAATGELKRWEATLRISVPNALPEW